MDLGEHLAQYRDKQVLLIVAVVGEADPNVALCGICGFPMSNAEECPRCKLSTKEATEAIRRAVDEKRLMDEIEDHLSGLV